jgi:hypothetical protein
VKLVGKDISFSQDGLPLMKVGAASSLQDEQFLFSHKRGQDNKAPGPVAPVSKPAAVALTYY